MKRLVAVAVVAACVALVGLARAADDANPTGTWKWTFTAGGQEREITLKLKQDGDKLSGVIVQGNRETPIEEAQFKDGEVSFKTTRTRNEQKIVTKYTGKVSGDAIKGKTSVSREGQAGRERDWEAKRVKE